MESHCHESVNMLKNRKMDVLSKKLVFFELECAYVYPPVKTNRQLRRGITIDIPRFVFGMLFLQSITKFHNNFGRQFIKIKWNYPE